MFVELTGNVLCDFPLHSYPNKINVSVNINFSISCRVNESTLSWVQEFLLIVRAITSAILKSVILLKEKKGEVISV